MAVLRAASLPTSAATVRAVLFDMLTHDAKRRRFLTQALLPRLSDFTEAGIDVVIASCDSQDRAEVRCSARRCETAASQKLLKYRTSWNRSTFFAFCVYSLVTPFPVLRSNRL